MKRKFRVLSLILCLIICFSFVGCDKEKPNTSNFEYIHLSLDDTMECFRNLGSDPDYYDSLFDEPFFRALKELHDEYGMKISLYSYNVYLENVPDKFADEFSDNADWLKIGLHSESYRHLLTNKDYATGKTYWETFVGHVERICGSTDSLDLIPRFESFQGSYDCLMGMKSCSTRPLGFLTPEFKRESAYYLSDELIDYLYVNDHVKDKNNDFLFLGSDMLLEWFRNIIWVQSRPEGLASTPYEQIVKMNNDATRANANKSFVVYSHENLMYDGWEPLEDFALLEEVCRFASDYGVPFDFPQNRTYADTDGDALFN